MEDCPIIVIDEANSPTIDTQNNVNEKEVKSTTESAIQNLDSQHISNKVQTKARKHSSKQGTKALSIKESYEHLQTIPSQLS